MEPVHPVSDDLLRAAFQQSPLAMAQLADDGRCIAANRRLCEMLGYSATELARAQFLDLIHPEDHHALECVHKLIDREIEEFQSECRLVSKTGEIIWVDLTIACIQMPEFSRHYSVIVQNVVPRVAATALAESSSLLTLLIERTPIGIAVFDREMKYLAASRHFIKAFGLSRSMDTKSIVGKSHYDLFPEIPERWRQIHRRVLSGETLAREEDSFERSDGRIDYVRWDMMPWRRPDHSIGGAVLFSTVTTAHKAAERRAEEELTRTADEFRTLADNIPTLCWMAYADGHIYWYNKRWYEYTGTSPDTQEGWGWESVHDPKALPEVMRQWRRSLSTGEPFEMTFPLKGADGVFRRFLTRIIPVRDNDGNIVRWFGTNTNIEDQKIAEERERLLAREVDHRAKNMLAVVQGMVQLSRGTDIASYKDAIVRRIHALALAHNLLAAERWSGVELQQLVREEVAPFAGAKPARISVIGTPLTLAPTSAQTFALLLHELTTNSVKYGALSNDEGRVDISWGEEGAAPDICVRFRWHESGGPRAVPPSKQGFGFTLLRTGVERQLGGKLALAWPDQGLICDLLVPMRNFVASATPAEARAEPVVPRMAPQLPEFRRVLLVEDEALVGLELETALMRAGMEVLGPATTLPEALRLASEAAADMALLDINLQGEHSFPVAEVLKMRGIPFVFCTGYARRMIIPEEFSHIPVVEKPYTIDRLFQAMDRAAEQSGPRKSPLH